VHRFAGGTAWQEVLQQQCQIAKKGGHTNLSALLQLVNGDVLASSECYR
jgi:hypothetical protein